MRVELHTGAVADLIEPWTRLHAGQSAATPFTAPGWVLPWWRHFGADAEPFTLVVEDAGEVVGLALLVLRRRGPLRVLEPAGMEPGDYWDVLAAPDRQSEVATAVAAQLVRLGSRWDAWIVRCLPPPSALEPAIDRMPALVRPRIPAPSLDLPEDFDTYLAGLSSSRRQNLRRHLRRLDDGTVVLHEVVDPADLAGAIARWREFRAAQWEAAGKDINPVHLAPHFSAFIADACAELIPVQKAQVWQFEHEGGVIGTYVNFCDEDAYHWYLGGFDPAYTSLGLGKIAIGHGIRTSVAAGRKRYDFGRGAEPYKYWYGAQDRMLAARVAGTGRARSRAARLAARAYLRARRGEH